MMGRVATVIVTERDADGALSVRCDPGGEATVTAPHFAPPGYDAVPLPGDTVALEDTAGAGAEQATGYHDARNPGLALPGEARPHARDADGVLVGHVYAMRDGSVEVRSFNGMPLRFVTDGPVEIVSPDVRISDAAGAGLARVGDIVMGTLHALSASPGTPIAPGPPVPGAGVPFVAQIVSGSTKAKA